MVDVYAVSVYVYGVPVYVYDLRLVHILADLLRGASLIKRHEPEAPRTVRLFAVTLRISLLWMLYTYT